jgi:hypothetical protein
MSTDLEKLDAFIRQFYGYGSWDAPLWFIGMEEGGGRKIEELDRRLKAWDGTEALADLKDYHAALGGTGWFAERPKLQTTWAKLIRIAMKYEGKAINGEAVRAYQRDELARRAGTTALIELLPLPSPSLSEWLYATLNVPSLESRESYQTATLPFRKSAIRTRLERHKPEVVVFYGRGYQAHWEDIAQRPFARPDGYGRFLTAANDATRFVIAPHPAAKGVANADFDAIGDWLATR